MTERQVSGRADDLSSEATALLQAFYTGGEQNRIHYEQAFDPTTAREGYRQLQRWAAPLLEGDAGVLVRNGATGSSWYGVARSEPALRRLSEELVAFVGPSVSNVTGDRADLDPADPVEAAVRAFSQGFALRFEGSDPEIAEAVDRLYRVRERKQHRAPAPTRSAGLVLRAFHMALVAGLPDEASAARRELQERALLSPLNLHFLRVQELSAYARWGDLVGDEPQIPLARLLAVPRPRAVTDALLQAVYHVYLAPHAANPTALAATFEETVAPRFAPLLSARHGLRTVEALRTFMAQAVAESEGELRDDVLTTARHEGLGEDPLLGALAKLVDGAPPDTASLERAEASVLQGAYGRAFDMAQRLEPSLRRTRVLIQCAYEVPSTEVAAAALAAVHDLPEPEQALLFESRFARDAYEQITGTGGDTDPSDVEEADAEVHDVVPTSWGEWIEAVLDGSLPHGRAVRLAETGGREWSPAALSEQGTGPEGLATALEDAATSAGAWTTVQHALPHLLESLQRDPQFPRPSFYGLYHRLLACVAATPHPGDSDLAVFADLAATVLRGPLDPSGYRTVVDGGVDLWEHAASTRRLDWVLDMLELLAVHAVPDRRGATAFRRRRRRRVSAPPGAYGRRPTGPPRAVGAGNRSAGTRRGPRTGPTRRPRYRPLCPPLWASNCDIHPRGERRGPGQGPPSRAVPRRDGRRRARHRLLRPSFSSCPHRRSLRDRCEQRHPRRYRLHPPAPYEPSGVPHRQGERQHAHSAPPASGGRSTVTVRSSRRVIGPGRTMPSWGQRD